MKDKISLAHVHLETQLVISDEFVQLLIVENPGEFYAMVTDLDGQFNGREGQFVFSCDGGFIAPSKCGEMVSDLFHFGLNDKKILTLLHRRLESTALGEMVEKYQTVNTCFVSMMEELSFSVPFAIDYSEPQPIDYLKAAGVRFEENYESLEEKIICYLNALIELKKCKFFIFVNLKSVLSDEKLSQLYAHCKAEQVGLLLIENAKIRPLLPCERAVIVTEDLCEILENYGEVC